MDSLTLTGNKFPFIKVGTHWLHVANISIIERFENGNVYANFGAMGPIVEFKGAEAEAVLEWLEKESLDITPRSLAVGDDFSL